MYIPRTHLEITAQEGDGRTAPGAGNRGRFEAVLNIDGRAENREEVGQVCTELALCLLPMVLRIEPRALPLLFASKASTPLPSHTPSLLSSQ